MNSEDNPSPAKRPRTDSVTQETSSQPTTWQASSRTQTSSTLQQGFNGTPRPPSVMSLTNGAGGKPTSESPEFEVHKPRFASKPLIPRAGDPISHYKDSRKAAVVSSICQRDEPGPVLELLREIFSEPSNPDGPSTLDIDTVLDDQGHTALHIAASLGRQQTVDALKTHGADIHRGNFLGETPLIRACLATHNADQQSFGALVVALHPSIRTLDTSRKSVLHHIVSLAGVKGRVVAARDYLDQIFLWIAQQQSGDFRSIVDLQDEHGDTALNIAARVGNRSLVRTLLDVGANRILPNKLGLRPGDFGVETEVVTPPKSLYIVFILIYSLGTKWWPKGRGYFVILTFWTPSPSSEKSRRDSGSVFFFFFRPSRFPNLTFFPPDMTAMIQNLSAEFQGEIKTKQDALDVTQAHLRAATRELSEQRKQIQSWQARCGELDQVSQRVRNVEKAIMEEDRFDWTGRTDLDGNDGRDSAGPAFQYRGPSSTMIGIAGSVDISFSVDIEPPLPSTDSVATLIKLRRLKLWHLRVEELVKTRLKGLQGATAEKEYQCKKIVALCTGLPIDKVEDVSVLVFR
jgi:regulatory protein SWI6